MKGQHLKLPPIKRLINNTEQDIHDNNNSKQKQMKMDETRLEQQAPQPTPKVIDPQPTTLKDKLTIVAVLSVVAAVICLTILPVLLIPLQTTIVIVGTNDLHGKVYPTSLFRSDTSEQYNYGGLTYMSTLMGIVSEEYQNNTLYLDAGDQFQGGIQSSKLVSYGEIMNDFFKKVNLKGSAIGNHQFDFGPQFLFPYMSGRSTPNLAANIISQTGQSNFMPNQEGERLYELPCGIKIGVIGLTTLETPYTTATFINGKFPAYSFLDYKDIVISRAANLRQKGANAIVLVSHVGNSCNNDFINAKRTASSTDAPCPLDEISVLLDELPNGTVDAIVQGHRHRTAHHYYKGVPYMGAISGGYYLNFLYIKFDSRTKKIKDSVIEGPVPVCEKVFENIGRCNYLQSTELATAGNLVNWKFHGKDVKADTQFDQILQSKWSAKMAPYLEYIAKTQIILNATRDKESDLGNMFTYFLHQLVPDSNFTILNTGGFRTQWYPGVITYQNYYNMFPFENLIQTFTMTGSQLLNSINVLQSGVDLFATWGLKVSIDVNSTTGAKAVTSAMFSNGTAIDAAAVYKGVTIKYLLDGGDRFSRVMGITYNKTNVADVADFRATLKSYLVNVGTVRGQVYKDPLNPTIILNNI